MDDLRDLVNEAVRHVRAAPEDLEHTLRRVRARQWNRRVAAAITALLVAAGGMGLAWWAFGSGQPTTPATLVPERIVFTTQGPDDMMPLITLMDTDGSHVRTLAPGVDPAWSPNGSMIAFMRASDDGRSGIYVMNADGTGERRLTTNPQGMDEGPSWSPDGRTIVFSRSTFLSMDPDPIASKAHRDLYTVGLDGGEPAELLGGTTDDFDPSWSPDGSRIAFARVVDPTSDGPDSLPQIWTTAPDGTDAVQLTRDGRIAQDPAWSPDASILSFSDGGSDICLIGADGEGLHRLEIPSGWGEEAESPYGATWSPDGRRLAFSAGGEQGHDIFLVDLDGSNLERLSGPGAEDNEPSWVAPSEASATTTPTPDTTETASPSVSECFGSRSSGDFDGDGQIDTVKLRALVPLPRCGPEAVQTEWRIELTVDLASGTISVPFEDCGEPFDCMVLEGSDVDGDGRAELPIVLGPGAAISVAGMYRVTETSIRALDLAAPGDPGYLEPGPIRLGGPSDAISQTGFECRTLDTGSRIVVAWSAHRDDGVSPWRVHFTTLELREDVFVVVGTEDREDVVDLPPVWGTCP
jgi:TolB protein